MPSRAIESWTVVAAIGYAVYRLGVVYLGLPAYDPPEAMTAAIDHVGALLVILGPSVAAVLLRMRRRWFGSD